MNGQDRNPGRANFNSPRRHYGNQYFPMNQYAPYQMPQGMVPRFGFPQNYPPPAVFYAPWSSPSMSPLSWRITMTENARLLQQAFVDDEIQNKSQTQAQVEGTRKEFISLFQEMNKSDHVIEFSTLVNEFDQENDVQENIEEPKIKEDTPIVVEKEDSPIPPIPEVPIEENIEVHVEESQREPVYLIGCIINNRRTYSVMELLQARNFEGIKFVDIQIPHTENNRIFLKDFKKPNVIYKRSSDAWVRADERFRLLNDDELKVEKCKIQIQRAFNKYSRKTHGIVQKEVTDIPIKDLEMTEFLIDCLYKNIITNAAWVNDLSKLCCVLNTFYTTNKIKFSDLLVDKFITGTCLPQEWIDRYTTTKERKVSKVEELDSVNEELQLLEQSMRVILEGCAKFLAHLNMCELLSDKKMEVFMEKCKTLKHDLEMEMICAFCTELLEGYSQIKPNIKKRLTELMNIIKKNMESYPMRVQFIISDVQAAYDKHTKCSKVTIKNLSTTGSAKNIQMAPDNRRPSVRSGFKFQKSTNNSGYSFSQQKIFGKQDSRNREPTPRSYNESPRQNVEIHKPSEETLEKDSHNLEDMILRFSKSFEAEKFSDELKDYEIANHMKYFIRRSFSIFVVKSKINHLYYGNLLALMIRQGRLDRMDILSGLEEFLVDFYDSIEDFPKLHECIAKCLLPLLLLGVFKIEEYVEFLNKQDKFVMEKLLVGLFSIASSFTSIEVLRKLWKDAKLDGKIRDRVWDEVPKLNEQGSGSLIALEVENNWQNSIKLAGDICKKPISDDNFNKYLMDFCNLIYYISPMTRDVTTEPIMAKIVTKYQDFFKNLLNTPSRVDSFFQYINELHKSQYSYPFHITICLTKALIKQKLLDLETVETAITKIENSDVQQQFLFFKTSLV